MSLKLARVVAVHPKRRTVDLVLMENGQRFADVQLMSNVSGDSGSWSVPSVPKPTDEAKPDKLQPGRNLVAVVAFMGHRPIVQGFIHPSGTQMAFSEDNREVHRHPSGAYHTVAPDGSIEVFHPSGAFFRIGTGDHQDLAPLAADSNWKIPAGAADPQITLHTAGFKFTVLPNGAVTMDCPGSDVTMNYKTLTANGPSTFNGNMQLNGTLNVSQTITAVGDVKGAAISLDGHHHLGVQSGPSQTGNPI